MKIIITSFKKGNLEAINDELCRFYEQFKDQHLARTVNSNWELYKIEILRLQNKCIPALTMTSDSRTSGLTDTSNHVLTKKRVSTDLQSEVTSLPHVKNITRALNNILKE